MKIRQTEKDSFTKREKLFFNSCTNPHFDDLLKRRKEQLDLKVLTMAEQKELAVNLDICFSILKKTGFYNKDIIAGKIDPDYSYVQALNKKILKETESAHLF